VKKPPAPFEPLQRLRVLRHVFREKFEGDLAAEARVLGAIDHAHTAASQLFEDVVVRNALSNE
jgi:hypothetical protein